MQGLPPRRDNDHVIILKTRAKLVYVRPYKYDYHYKDEIKKKTSKGAVTSWGYKA